MTENPVGKAEEEDSGTPAPATRIPASNPTLIGIGGGVAAGIASSFIPMGAIEGFVSAYGIAELLPAAAPPLGNTARLALSTGIGTLTAGALLALLPRAETQDMGFESIVTKDVAGTAPVTTAPVEAPVAGGSKLGGWLRTLRFGKAAAAPGEITDFADLARTRIRNNDQHPDAPARPPILASSDLGEPIEAVARDHADTEVDTVQKNDLRAPFTLDGDMAVTSVQETIASSDRALRFSQPLGGQILTPDADTRSNAFEPAARQQPVVHLRTSSDLDNLSVAELLDRLEQGLHRRTQNGQSTASAPAETALPDGRPFRLAQVEQVAPPAESFEQDGSHPVRFKLDHTDQRQEADTLRQVGSPGGNDSWESEVEYHPPEIGEYSLADDDLPEHQLTKADDVGSAPDTMSQPADDDMDAALRDALATLRQLSERQRNA